MRARILIVDDEKLVRWTLRQALEEAGYSAEEAADGRSALQAVARDAPDMVLLDYRLPDILGTQVLRDIRDVAPLVPVVMITAHASIGGAVEAIRDGAYDYISKPFEVDEVIQVVARALETGRLREEVARQRERALTEVGGLQIVAESPAMKSVLRMVQRVATSEATTVLLLGESGVGKGLVSRILHAQGTSADRPFMTITCTALPDTLLESELFGHEKGAFTDARTLKKGLFELADGGTVFLDEIGDISASLQAKLLRVLEEKTFRRVGGTRDITVAVRIVAATNKDLAGEVEAGRFREDLFYRLNVIPVTIPPLRERMEDVLPLAEAFLEHFNHEFGKSVQGFGKRAVGLLTSYGWPGNVRELRNVIERAVLLTENASLREEDLASEIREFSGVGPGGGNGHGGFDLPAAGVVLEELEESLVRQALDRTGGNRSGAARLLGLNRDQIRYRIEKFGIGVEKG